MLTLEDIDTTGASLRLNQNRWDVDHALTAILASLVMMHLVLAFTYTLASDPSKYCITISLHLMNVSYNYAMLMCIIVSVRVFCQSVLSDTVMHISMA